MVPSGSLLAAASNEIETEVDAVVVDSVNEATGGLSVTDLLEVVESVLPVLSVTVRVTV